MHSLLTIDRSQQGAVVFFFLEVERRDYVNYPKIKHYEAYYTSGAWVREGWAMGGKVFPAIVVVAEGSLLKKIHRQVLRANPQAPWQFLSPSEVATWVAQK